MMAHADKPAAQPLDHGVGREGTPAGLWRDLARLRHQLEQTAEGRRRLEAVRRHPPAPGAQDGEGPGRIATVDLAEIEADLALAAEGGLQPGDDPVQVDGGPIAGQRDPPRPVALAHVKIGGLIHEDGLLR